MILEIGRDMLWGEDLQALCKANISMIKELLHKFSNYGFQIRVISLIVWSGNEICGEYGVEPLPIWDHKDPKGDWEEIMTRVKGNVEWWNKQLLELGVDQAALVSEPGHLVYSLSMIFTTFMDLFKKSSHKMTG